jgi:hypothetical protein
MLSRKYEKKGERRRPPTSHYKMDTILHGSRDGAGDIIENTEQEALSSMVLYKRL